jgi:hypothetical protein
VDYTESQKEFSRFVRHLRGLTILEMKFIIWHYFNKEPYRRLAELDEKKWSRQYSQQIVKRGINKIREI